MSQKLKTVNVVECINHNTLRYNITSFTESDEGNREAEAHFLKIAQENGFRGNMEDEEEVLNNGFYEYGDYSVILIHS